MNATPEVSPEHNVPFYSAIVILRLMKKEDVDRLEKLRWEHERITKQALFEQKLKQLFCPQEYIFLSFDESDKIQESSDDWPCHKWESHLYLQVDIQQPEKINAVIKRFLALSDQDFCRLFSMNYNFGLVEMAKNAVFENWIRLLDIDGDQIFLSLPGKTDFLCIEKTEDKIVGQEDEGIKWIYEITYSSINLKLQLEKNGT